MAQNKEKIVQAMIQAVKEVSSLVIKADNLAQAYKAKYNALNPDLSDTSLTANQLQAVNTFIISLNELRNDVVVTTVMSKDVPSHGTGALD